MNKRAILVLSIILAISCNSFAGENNDLRTLFLNNNSNIMGINIRTFNAKDTNGNEIIDEDEESGNFLNAIERLNELKDMGINTLHVLPITPVGKLKALGTAGSLYALAGFNNINEQLVDKNSDLTPKEQAKKFIEEAHARGIRIIIDLPSCGAYDLYVQQPELFIKDDKNISIVPTDWTDVRLLNTGTNEKLNQDVLDVHKGFIDMILELGADGVRADVATIKPYKFWEEIIKYTRDKDKEFMFLAEASDSWREPPSQYAVFTPYNELLKAGFDGYYGSFFNLKDWNADEFIEHIKFNQKLLKSYKEPKSVIMSFTTHDEVSPVVLHGQNFSIMISWLEAVLPFNPYSIDGFAYGDEYIYSWANGQAKYTETDDDTYFVHRGKLDIFNFSRKPGEVGVKGINGVNETNEVNENDSLSSNNNSDKTNKNANNVLENFKQAYKFRADNIDLITKGEFVPIKTNDEKVFAFLISKKGKETEQIVVLGNLDFKNYKNDLTIKIPKLNKKSKFELIHGDNNIKFNHKKLHTNLKAGEIKIIKTKNI